MGLSITGLLAQTRPVTFQAGDQTVTLQVRVFPHRVEKEQLEEWGKLPALEGLSHLLPLTVASWDITGDDGTPLPVEQAALAALPEEAAELLGLAHSAAVADRLEGKAPSAPSSAGSTPTEP